MLTSSPVTLFGIGSGIDLMNFGSIANSSTLAAIIMRILITITPLLFSLLTFAQVDNSKITKIRKAVEQINKDSGYTIKKLESEEFLEQTPDNGAELTGYLKNGQLIKITEWIGLSSCINITEYYLQANKLIFTYTKGSESTYLDSLQTFDLTKLNMTMECRFYFDNDKVIKTILNGATRCSGQPTSDLSKEYLEECSRYKKLFVKK